MKQYILKTTVRYMHRLNVTTGNYSITKCTMSVTSSLYTVPTATTTDSLGKSHSFKCIYKCVTPTTKWFTYVSVCMYLVYSFTIMHVIKCYMKLWAIFNHVVRILEHDHTLEIIYSNVHGHILILGDYIFSMQRLSQQPDCLQLWKMT